MNNYQFHFAHFRVDAVTDELKRYHRGQSTWTPAARGGSTVCRVLDADGNPVSTGRALCSLQDAFCYRLGRRIAKGRALKKLKDSQMSRSVVINGCAAVWALMLEKKSE